MSSIKHNLPILFSMFLCGCAIQPDLGPLPKPDPERMYAAAHEIASLKFPDQKWWESYNDPQLTALIEEGVSKSPSMAEALARLKKANADALVAGAPLLPELDVQGSYQKYKQSYNNGIPSSAVPHGFKDSSKLTLNFNYEIDFWGKNREQLRAALSEVTAAKLDAAQARIMISTAIAQNYAELAQIYTELDEARKGIEIRKKTIKMFQDLYSGGLESQGGLNQAQADLALAEADIVSLEEQIDLKKLNIVALMGKNPDWARFIDQPDLHYLNAYKVPSVIPADLIGHRPDLMAARMHLETAAHLINVARTGYYPNVNLAAYIGFQSLGLDLFFRKGSVIGAAGPAIYLPLFKGGEIEGRYRGAHADYEIALAQYESLIVQALQEVASVLASQKAQALEVEKMRAAVKASESAYCVNNDRYKGGIANYIEVLNAENTLIASKRKLASAEMRLFILNVALIKSLGGGFPCDIKEKGKS